MRALVFVYIIEEIAHNHAEYAPLIKNWARSCVQAAEQDLLVAYPVIDICVKIHTSKKNLEHDCKHILYIFYYVF